MSFALRAADLTKIESMTRYPSIETYHQLGDKGVLTEKVTEFGDADIVYAFEKIDGGNVRIIVDGNGDWVIGSRTELLAGRGDWVTNPVSGFVEAVTDAADRISGYVTDPTDPTHTIHSGLRVFYVEVYGHSSMKPSRNYTETGELGYRLFDVADIPDAEEVSSWNRERIASWRDHDGQKFYDATMLDGVSIRHGMPAAPMIRWFQGISLPRTVADTHTWLRTLLPHTLVALDEGAKGAAEGIVLRNETRSVIRKIRYASYERTEQVRAQAT